MWLTIQKEVENGMLSHCISVKKKLQENMITILVMIMIRCKNSVLDRLSVVSTRPNPTDPIREWLHSTWVTCVLVSSCLIFTCLSSCLLGGMIRKNMFVFNNFAALKKIIKKKSKNTLIDLKKTHQNFFNPKMSFQHNCFFYLIYFFKGREYSGFKGVPLRH